MSVDCWLLLVERCSMFVVCCTLLVVGVYCCLLFVVVRYWCSSCGVRCLWFVVY